MVRNPSSLFFRLHKERSEKTVEMEIYDFHMVLCQSFVCTVLRGQGPGGLEGLL